MKQKKPKERQYEIPVGAKFIVCATSLAEARKMLEEQLMGMATTQVVVGAGQLRLPQEDVSDDENG